MGSVVPSTQEIAEGGEATVTATAASGHVIESWAGADQVTGVGESTGTAKVINVRSNKNKITCNFKSSGGQQSGRKAIIAMGFPYAESGYDATYKINKIPNVSIARSFNDIDNVEFGSFINPGNPAGGFYPPNAQFYGKQTGDNRGVYPDYALKYNIWSYNKVDATCSLSVPQGVYNISLLLNADSSLSWGNSVPVVLNLVNITVGGIAKSPTLITNNTNTLLVFENINTTGEIVITINTGTTGTRVPLNVIEIEKIS